LADDTEVEILNVLDDHSRLAIASDARAVFKAADVVACFHGAAGAHGFPSSLLTDNGAVFTARPRKGRCVLEVETTALGISFVHSRPYNTVRPHRAIGRRSPAEAFGSRPKAAPSGPRLVVPPHYRVRRDKFDITGVITLRHNSRLHHLGLGRKLIGTRVLALVDGLHVRVLTEDGELLRDLTLDPTRDYQPHGRS
jgi:hypothetical protein